MLMRFYELRNEVKQFMKMKGKPVRKLNDSKWLCDLAFMVDINYQVPLRAECQAAGPQPASQLPAFKREII
jgi:hypothetical protein